MEYENNLFTCSISCNYWQHWGEKPCVNFLSLLLKNVQGTLMYCNFARNSFCAWFIWFDIWRETAGQLSPLLPMQASGLSRDKRWVVLSDRLLPRLRYRPFLFYSPSKLVTAKRFPWWKISFNIYFLPDTLLFFYWVECVLSLSEQVFMQSSL